MVYKSHFLQHLSLLLHKTTSQIDRTKMPHLWLCLRSPPACYLIESELLELTVKRKKIQCVIKRFNDDTVLQGRGVDASDSGFIRNGLYYKRQQRRLWPWVSYSHLFHRNRKITSAYFRPNQARSVVVLQFAARYKNAMIRLLATILCVHVI